MIALCGRVRRREAEPSVKPVSAPDATKPSVIAVDDNKSSVSELPPNPEEWIWTGEWSFGAIVDETSPTNTRLPFSYTWIQPLENSTTDKVEAKAESIGKNTPIASTALTTQESIPGTQEEVTEKKAPNDQQSLPLSGQEGKQTTAPAQSGAPSQELKREDIAKETSTRHTVEFFGTTLPTSGLWKGTFDTLVGRKGQQKQSPVKEHFYLTWKVSPMDSADPTSAADSETPGETVEEVRKLLPKHVYVTGRGENQYGNFMFVGALDTGTGILQCQKSYVIASDPAVGHDKAHKQHDAPRPYQTRKRQMSWKRRAAYDSGDDSQDPNHPDGESRKQPPLKKQRLMSDATSVSEYDGTLEASSLTAGNPLTLTVSAPTTTADGAAGKRGPTPSSPASRSSHPPSDSSAPKKRTATTTAATKGTAGSMPTALNLAQQAGQLKLPNVGDPFKARWRAAHFLYYHRDDPAVAPLNTAVEGSNGANAHAAPATVSAPAPSPMYLVYEGEMLNSHRHGRGVCLYNNGMLYEGEWMRDKEHGYGSLMSSDRKYLFFNGVSCCATGH
jgi:MORN repeat